MLVLLQMGHVPTGHRILHLVWPNILCGNGPLAHPILDFAEGIKLEPTLGIQRFSREIFNLLAFKCWLVVEPTPLKNMSSSLGMMTFPYMESHRIPWFQSTNQKCV
jgi:hypothetical protein